jgi:threonine-phosphate decarboxylase
MAVNSSHGGNIFDFASRRLLDFSSNINPSGPPSYALAEAARSLELISRYPDTAQTEIRSVFSAWLGVCPEELVFGNGACELIRAVMAVTRPSRLVVTYPTFSEYGECAGLLGVPVLGVPSIPSLNFAFDVDGIKNVLSRGDLLVICQPNNPTGVPWKKSELSELAGLCSSLGAFLLVDECFINLSWPKLTSSLGFIGKENVIVLRAVTKDFAAPGLRVGFIAARPDITRAVRGYLQPWPLNCVGEAFAIACAKRPEPYMEESARALAVLRDEMSRGIVDSGFSPNPAAANFLLVRCDFITAHEVHDFLLERSILVRKCANFPTLDDRYFRAAVRAKEDNLAFLSGLSGLASIATR